MTQQKKISTPRRSSRKGFGLQQIVILAVLIVLFVFFYCMSKSFRKYTTIVQICSYMYYIMLMAIGVTFPLITGGVDLSIGTGLICYSVIGSYLIRINGWSTGWAIVLVLAMGVFVGFINGTIVSRLDLPPFITTLCTMMICRGLGSILTNSFCGTWPTVNQPGGWVRNLVKYVSPDKTIYPVGMIWIILLVIIMTVVLDHTRVGRYIIGIGSNKEALKLSGVNVVKWQTIAYMISGFFAALAAIAYAATFSTITPGTGAGFELDAIGSAIIGGTAMTGGSGTIVGTFLGVLIISVLKTGLPFIGLQANWQQLITGVILIAAVTMDVVRNSKRA
ncbi:MAG: ABC transporter permease [Clostridiales bacterium]|nr:ABC transporter permease [Clostridiales bacterium]